MKDWFGLALPFTHVGARVAVSIELILYTYPCRCFLRIRPALEHGFKGRRGMEELSPEDALALLQRFIAPEALERVQQAPPGILLMTCVDQGNAGRRQGEQGFGKSLYRGAARCCA